MSDHPHITYKRHTFLSSLAAGVSALLIVLVISCTTVVIYGVHFVGDRSDKFVSTVSSAIGSLDELQAALPPIMADVLDDPRQPDYRDQIEITARPAAPGAARSCPVPAVVSYRGATARMGLWLWMS